MALRLIFVRHGLSSFNRERRIQGRIDLSTLTKEGEQQAIQTGEILSSLAINAIYSSPLKRAKSTTLHLLQASKLSINPIFDKGLLEVDLGSWSGLTIDEVKSQFHESYETWKKDPKSLILTREDHTRFSPIKELMAQANEFIQKILKLHSLEKEQTVLIVAHNAILRCLIMTLLDGSSTGFRKIQLDNASISILNLTNTNREGLHTQVECLNSTTHLNPPLPPKGKNARIVLVRHGETDWNLEGRFQGQIDIPLNKNGHTQAAAASVFLSNQPINKAFSSSMSRPRQTAATILKSHPGVEIQLKEDLVEIGHGLWEGKLESEIQKEWPDLLRAWQLSPESVQMPNGETINDVSTRAMKCWKLICKGLSTQDTALVVAHDAVNKTILCELLGLKASDIWMIKQGNGGITVVDLSPNPDHPDVITCMNLTSHLGGILDTTAAGAL